MSSVFERWPNLESAPQAIKVIESLEARVKELESALNRLYLSCPTDINCHNMHHTKSERHSYDVTCPVVTEYYEAIKAAQAALKKEKP
jgi:outer membrane protein assembly factor BamD (BamD/ComL family)